MRIPSQLPAVTGLSELNRSLLDVGRLQERLSSGRRLNRASDGPAALVISERLRSQLAAISQAGENVARVGNVLQTAEGAFGQVADLLTRGQALSIEAANVGAQSPEELDAIQGDLDSIVDSVRRIGLGTQFASQRLTDGSRAFTVEDANAAFRRVEVQQTRSGFAPSTVSVGVTAAATRGQAGGAIAAAQVGQAQVQITGAQGTAVLDIGDGATRAQVAAAINGATGATGVEADAVTGVVRAVEYGSNRFVDVRNLTGTLTGVTEGRTAGSDVQASVNGIQSDATGNVIEAQTGELDARLTLADGTGAGTYTFRVTGGGFAFQAGDGADPSEQGAFAIPSVLPSDLGRSVNNAGLESAVTGGVNSVRNNPAGTASVFAAALDDLGRARGQVGALQANTFDSLRNNLQVAYENVAASESQIGDTDFAQTLAELAVKRIRGQAGIFAVQQSNLDAQNVLRLLG